MIHVIIYSVVSNDWTSEDSEQPLYTSFLITSLLKTSKSEESTGTDDFVCRMNKE